MSSDRFGKPSTRIHLLRHAHAGDAAEWSDSDDLRPLTAKGRRQSERLGGFMREHGIHPDVIVSSPKVRALQTAEIVAGELGMTVRQDGRLADFFGPSQMWALLDELGTREPLFVGHDPDLSVLLGFLLGCDGVVMRKGALASVDIESRLGDGDGFLRWLLPPDLLA